VAVKVSVFEPRRAEIGNQLKPTDGLVWFVSRFVLCEYLAKRTTIFTEEIARWKHILHLSVQM